MSSNAFVWLIVAALALGGGVGGTVFALAGGDDSSQPPSLNAFDSPTATPSATALPDATFIPGDRQLGGGRFPRGGQQFELITGSVETLNATTLVLSNSDGTVEIAVDTETPVRISKAAADTGDALAVGTEILAILSRDSSGTITANNINVMGGDEGAVGRAGRGGGGFGGRGFGGDGGSINIATGTVDSFADGVLTLATTAGAVDILVADDTPVSWQKSFADAGDDLAPGTEITAIGSRAEDGTFQLFTITTGSLELQRGGFGGRRGQDGTGTGGGDTGVFFFGGDGTSGG